MATPYDAPIPGAAQYGQAALGAKTAYENALARINQKRMQTLRSYGYRGEIDPQTGTLQNLSVDPFNQYGGLQSMLRNQALAGEQAEFANEERGVHGGLANKAFSQLKYDAGAQSAQLGQDLTGALAELQDEQNQAAYDRNKALHEAELEATHQAIENQDFNPADFSGLEYPDYHEDPLTQPAAKPVAAPTPAAPASKAIRAKTLTAKTRAAIRKSGAKANDAILRRAVQEAARKRKGGR